MPPTTPTTPTTTSTASDDGKELRFFAPTYAINKDNLTAGKRFLFKVGALAYSIEKTSSAYAYIQGTPMKTASP
jgi:hypothetical protein